MICTFANADAVQQRLGTCHGDRLRDAICQLRQHNVFQRRKLWQQVVKLVDKSDVPAARSGSQPIRQPAHVGTTKCDGAAVGRVQ